MIHWDNWKDEDKTLEKNLDLCRREGHVPTIIETHVHEGDFLDGSPIAWLREMKVCERCKEEL